MTEHGPRGSRVDDILATIDGALADPGQHSPETTMYGDVAMAMPDEGTCWRCEDQPAAEDSESGLCAGCRAYLLEAGPYSLRYHNTGPGGEDWRDQVRRQMDRLRETAERRADAYQRLAYSVPASADALDSLMANEEVREFILGSAYGPYRHECRRYNDPRSSVPTTLPPAGPHDMWRAVTEPDFTAEELVLRAMRDSPFDRPVGVDLTPSQYRAIATRAYPAGPGRPSWADQMFWSSPPDGLHLFGLPVRVVDPDEHGEIRFMSGARRRLPERPSVTPPG